MRPGKAVVPPPPAEAAKSSQRTCDGLDARAALRASSRDRTTYAPGESRRETAEAGHLPVRSDRQTDYSLMHAAMRTLSLGNRPSVSPGPRGATDEAQRERGGTGPASD